MRTLFLLRHANAAGAGPSGDHSRPLSGKGRDAAVAIGIHLADHGKQPSAVLCSNADRALETWRLLAAQLADPPEAGIDRMLYGADGHDVLAAIGALTAAAEVVLVIGHNPTLHQLAFSLSRHGDEGAMNRLASDFPPGALAEIEFGDGGWADTMPGSGRLASLVTPADLV